MILSLQPVIRTAHVDATVNFYCDLLGFSVDERNDDWGWARLSKDSVKVMIAKSIADQDPHFTGSFYFEVDDVDSLWDAYKDKSSVCYEIEDFPWEMREFAIFDNNNYILQFVQFTGCS